MTISTPTVLADTGAASATATTGSVSPTSGATVLCFVNASNNTSDDLVEGDFGTPGGMFRGVFIGALCASLVLILPSRIIQILRKRRHGNVTERSTERVDATVDVTTFV